MSPDTFVVALKISPGEVVRHAVHFVYPTAAHDNLLVRADCRTFLEGVLGSVVVLNGAAGQADRPSHRRFYARLHDSGYRCSAGPVVEFEGLIRSQSECSM